MTRLRLAAAVACVCAAGAGTASAQASRPIPPAAADVRAVFAGFGQDAVTAKDLGVEVEELPTRGLGIAAGVHVYPVRRAAFALGLGGELLIARGSRQAPDDEDPTTPELPARRRRLQGLSGQLSINFGHRDGWSYLTAGMGPLLFQTYAGDIAPADPHRKMTINMGGGARWFTSRHVALNFDVRFYLTRPDDRLGDNPARERRRLLMMSVGMSIK